MSYKRVSLQDINITIGGDAVTIPGVYEEIENNYRRPIVISDLEISGVEASDRWVNFRPTAQGYIGLLGFNDSYEHLMLDVTSEDAVSIFVQ